VKGETSRQGGQDFGPRSGPKCLLVFVSSGVDPGEENELVRGLFVEADSVEWVVTEFWILESSYT
jgi:hypothetical protein